MFLTKKHAVKNTHTHKPTHNKHRLTEITDIHRQTHTVTEKDTTRQTNKNTHTDRHTHSHRESKSSPTLML